MNVRFLLTLLTLLVTNTIMASNVITYKATSQLPNATRSTGAGFHPDTFNVAVVSHTYNAQTQVGTITFAGEVTEIGYRAFYGCAQLLEINIPESVNKIGIAVFKECSSLQKIVIPNSVTEIGNAAFQDCSNLTTVILPNNLKTINEYLFVRCTALANITIPNSVTSIASNAFEKVLNIEYYGTATGSPWGARCVNGFVDGYLVYGNNAKTTIIACSPLIQGNLSIPNSVTCIGDKAFSGCTGLTSVTIPNSVTSIGYEAFYSCTGLASINVPNNVTGIGIWAFNGVNTIIYNGPATGSRWGANNVSAGYIDGYFIYSDTTKTILKGCLQEATGTLTIPNSVIEIEYGTFSKCNKITAIIIPSSVNILGKYAFNCSLKYLYVQSTNPPSLLGTLGGLIDYFIVPCGSKSAYQTAQYWENYSIQECPALIIETGGRGTYTQSNELSCANGISATMVTAIPNYGYHFSKWSDGVTTASRVVQVDDVLVLTAEFFPNKYTVSVTPNDSKLGTVSGNGQYDYLSIATLIATGVNKHYDLKEWNDGNKDNPRLLEVTQDTSLTAIFARKPISTILTNDLLMGSVTGSGEFGFREPDTIRAIADEHYCLDHWSDGSINNERVIYLTQDTTITAIFVPKPYITIEPNDAQLGKIEGANSGEYDLRQQLTITAMATEVGYCFSHWNDGSTDNTRTITISQDSTLTAFFVPIPTITVLANDITMGQVFGGGSAACNTTMAIAAQANVGYSFVKWSDGNNDNPRTITITQDSTFTAIFASKPVVTVLTNDTTMGQVTGGGIYDHNTRITIGAQPNYGYHFVHWSDGNTKNPRSLILTSDTAFTAIFARDTIEVHTIAQPQEGGTTYGDTIALYLDTVTIFAVPNYGYYFSSWGLIHTDNPYKVVLTTPVGGYGDTIIGAEFKKCAFNISTIADKSEGSITAPNSAKYLDTITLSAYPNYGYHFKKWNDGNTDNPRILKVTQDTTLEAHFAMDYSGKCGDNLYWQYANSQLTITGSGAMYNYKSTTMPWILLRDSISSISLSSDVTTIGEYAFAGCKGVNTISLGNKITSIGEGAFAGCLNLHYIYSYPTNPPTAQSSSFANYNVYLYAPCDNLQAYNLDAVFGSFKYVQCAGAEVAITDTLIVEPNVTDATFIWPSNPTAETYTLEIKKDGEVFCTLIFNSNGQLTSIAFAPSRDGGRQIPAAEQTTKGWKFTVTGLDAASRYTYDLDVRDASEQSIKNYQGQFQTDGITGIDQLTDSPTDPFTKIIQDGQLYILRDGKTYNAQGGEL